MAKKLTEEQKQLHKRRYQRNYFRKRYRTDPLFRLKVIKKVMDWQVAHPERTLEISAGCQRRWRKKNPERYLQLVCESAASAIVGQHEIDLANDDQRLSPDFIESVCLSLTRKAMKRTKK